MEYQIIFSEQHYDTDPTSPPQKSYSVDAGK